MRKRLVFGIALVTVLAMSAYVRAHPGHPHKIMGTVVTRHDNHLEIKATDGKTSMVTLNEKTRILRGRARAKAEDIKPGDRVVVTAIETKDKDGTTTVVATEIRLGTPPAPATK
jgi:hypothetical protein